MKSIFISLIILNTSSYLCEGESLLQKIIRFCPVWAMVPGVAEGTLAVVPALSPGITCIRATENFAELICTQAYLRYRGAPSPVAVHPHWLLLGSASRVFSKS